MGCPPCPTFLPLHHQCRFSLVSWPCGCRWGGVGWGVPSPTATNTRLLWGLRGLQTPDPSQVPTVIPSFPGPLMPVSLLGCIS